MRLASLGLLVLPSALGAAISGPIFSQYWPAYSSYSQSPYQFPWANTKIAMYFVAVTTQTGFTLGGGQSVSDMQAFVSEANAHGTKPLVSIGGWTGSVYFSKLVASNTSRNYFAGNITQFINSNGFAGVDLDWEYPNNVANGNFINDTDSANYLLFLQALRTTLGPTPIITAAVSMTGFLGPNQAPVQDLGAYAKYFDYINLMNYDVSGSWLPQTGPNSPLNSCGSYTSMTDALAYWISRGFPASQIVLGMPAYAIGFTTSSPTLTTTYVTKNGQTYPSILYQPKTNFANSGNVCGGSSGYCTYNDLIRNGVLTSDGKSAIAPFARYWDSCTSTPFVFNSQTSEMIVYDDSNSIGLKTKFARDNNVAGVMIFDSTGFAAPVYQVIADAQAGNYVPPPNPTFTNPSPPPATSTTTSTMTSTTVAPPATTPISSTSTFATSTKPLTTSTISTTATSPSPSTTATPIPGPTVRCINSGTFFYSAMVAGKIRNSASVNLPGGLLCSNSKIVTSSTRFPTKTFNCLKGNTSFNLINSVGQVSSIGQTPRGVSCMVGSGTFAFF